MVSISAPFIAFKSAQRRFRNLAADVSEFRAAYIGYIVVTADFVGNQNRPGLVALPLHIGQRLSDHYRPADGLAARCAESKPGPESLQSSKLRLKNADELRQWRGSRTPHNLQTESAVKILALS